jgi:hypothetical protein
MFEDLLELTEAAPRRRKYSKRAYSYLDELETRSKRRPADLFWNEEAEYEEAAERDRKRRQRQYDRSKRA